MLFQRCGYSGLTKELREYLIIWAVGFILGVTEIVDMKLTKRYEVAHLQVLVLDHSLIPESVDVIIGDFLYELQFKVGPKNDDEPVPMEMDNFDGPNDDTKKEGNDLDGKNGKKSDYGKGKELSKSNDGKSSGVKIGAPTQIWD